MAQGVVGLRWLLEASFKREGYFLFSGQRQGLAWRFRVLAGLGFLVRLKASSRASFAPTEVWGGRGFGGVGLECGALRFCGFAMESGVGTCARQSETKPRSRRCRRCLSTPKRPVCRRMSSMRRFVTTSIPSKPRAFLLTHPTDPGCPFWRSAHFVKDGLGSADAAWLMV